MTEDKSDQPGAAFWRSALALYERPGLAADLLALQDGHGGDVMAVLWAITAIEAGRSPSVADIRRFFDATAVARLAAAAARAERRRLKQGDPDDYAAAKRRELAAERAIAAAAPDPTTTGAFEPDLARRRGAVSAAFLAALPDTPDAAATDAYTNAFQTA